jgi:uncharacterized membrane protein
VQPSNNIQNSRQHYVGLILALIGFMAVATVLMKPARVASARVVGLSRTVSWRDALMSDQTGSARACTQIDVPGAQITSAQGINARGDIVGRFNDANNVVHGFLLPKHGPMVVIDRPNSTFNSALAINSKGVIVGNWEDPQTRRGFIWKDGQFTDVQFPGSSFTSAPSINESGDVAGRYILGGQPHGFILKDGVYSTFDVPGATDTAIFTLADEGELGGHYIVGTGASAVTHGFIRSEGELTTVDWPDDTLASSFNSVRGIAAGGEILVGSHHGPNTAVTHGYVLVDDALTNFDYPATGVTSTAIFGVNSKGAFVGGFSLGPPTIFQHGYVCGSNAIDDAQFFVHKHYLNFLNREPDPDGMSLWTNEINLCGTNQQCIAAKRVSVSAAFFLSIEFHQTGYLVYRFYKASYGNLPGAPVPLRFGEFLPDTQKIGQGVIVNRSGWETVLENNKQAFAAEFVQRARFTSVYPTSLTPNQFVDQLFMNAGVTPSGTDRTAAITEFGSATTTADLAARARALRRVAENSTLAQQEFNRAFVLIQYFGYLRRNPNDPPEPALDFQGYNFWLAKLNQFNGNFQNAEMVRAFLFSPEYRERFGQP